MKKNKSEIAEITSDCKPQHQEATDYHQAFAPSFNHKIWLPTLKKTNCRNPSNENFYIFPRNWASTPVPNYCGVELNRPVSRGLS